MIGKPEMPLPYAYRLPSGVVAVLSEGESALTRERASARPQAYIGDNIISVDGESLKEKEESGEASLYRTFNTVSGAASHYLSTTRRRPTTVRFVFLLADPRLARGITILNVLDAKYKQHRLRGDSTLVRLCQHAAKQV